MVENCRLCQSTETVLLTDKCNGYIEKTFFSIYRCNTCSAHFTLETGDNKNLFDDMYMTDNIHAYERYFKYAEAVLEQKDPLHYLAKQELPYFAAEQLISEYNTGASVLDVGCGLGYLSHAIACRGYEVLGIDVSQRAFEFAVNRYSPEFQKTDIFNLSAKREFDIIIGLEVIESLESPIEFIQAAVNMLKPEGKLLITFPNKDFYHNKAVWLTVPPPLNTIWINKKAIQSIAQNINATIQFIEPEYQAFGKTNLFLLRLYNLFKKDVFSDHFVKQQIFAGDAKSNRPKKLYKKAIHSLLKNNIIVSIMNYIYVKADIPLPTIVVHFKKQ